MKTKLRLRSPAAALLLAMALTIFPYTNPQAAPGLVTGSGAAACFDPDDLQAAFGMDYAVRPAADIEEAFRTVVAATAGDLLREVIFCLDGSEAAGEYSPALPASPDDLEKIGSKTLYDAQYGAHFTHEDKTYRLDKADAVYAALRELHTFCKNKSIQLTLVFLPLHESRLSSIDQKDLTRYKTRLAALCGLWDFSRSDLSADSRYFYTKDAARASTLALLLDKMNGKPVPVQNFGLHLTGSNAASQLDKLNAQVLPADDGGYTQAVPILLYHHLTETPATRADIAPDTFRSHMEALKQAGYTAVTAADLIAYVREGKPLPENPVWITFDDGYTSNYDYAYPILKALDMKATIFMIGSSVGKSTYKDTGHPITPHFTLKQAREMERSGVIEMGSHTFDLHQHAGYEPGQARETALPLPGESSASYTAALQQDYAGWKALWGRDPHVLAYPKGQYTDLTEEVFHSLGIDLTLSTTTDRENILVRGLPQSLYALCRYDIPEDMTAENLVALLR